LSWDHILHGLLTLAGALGYGAGKALINRFRKPRARHWCKSCHTRLFGLPKFCPNCGARMRR